jgi:hypothetical protein
MERNTMDRSNVGKTPFLMVPFKDLKKFILERIPKYRMQEFPF